MNQKIAEFPSKVMYHSKLRSHKSVASHLLDDLPNTSAEDDDEAEEVLRTPVVFIDTAGSEYYERVEGDLDEGSKCNENEAMVVKKYITHLVRLCQSSIYIHPKHTVLDRFRRTSNPNSCYHTVSVFIQRATT
jgi:superfamily I DNA and/or RNA helicase